jgi:hypothetical protein
MSGDEPTNGPGPANGLTVVNLVSGDEQRDDEQPAGESGAETIDESGANEQDERSAEAGFTDIQGFAQILEAAHALERDDLVGASRIMREAATAGLSETEADLLVRVIAKAVGLGVKATRLAWRQAVAEEAGRTQAQAQAARAAADAAQAAEEQRKREEEKERLRASCASIAESPTLLADMVEVVQVMGVVGEGASIRGAYLAMTSRLLKRRAICLLRRGAPSGGKNFLFETIFRIIPEEAVVRISSASPTALIYYGGQDEDALKHRIVYIPEVASLIEKGGGETPHAVMLRGLISEGAIDRVVTLTRSGSTPVSVRVLRNGPIVGLLTSARANVEEELLTRLLSSDADESDRQTLQVLKRSIGEEEREIDAEEIERWLDFQRWLELDRPYDVVIPFRRAFWTAFARHWRGLRAKGEKLKLRIRRDAHGFQSAIRTSAVLHQAQRARDEKGRIIATLDDYRSAHEAFDAGLASLYQVLTPETLMAVVKAIRSMGATETSGVKVTVRALMDRLGIAGFGTALERLRDAEAHGLIELVAEVGGYGATSARWYKIGKEQTVVADLLGSVFQLRSRLGVAAVPGLFGPQTRSRRAPRRRSDRGDARGADQDWIAVLHRERRRGPRPSDQPAPALRHDVRTRDAR